MRGRGLGERGPVILAAAGSLLLSALALWRGPVVNNDGVVYLLAARVYAAAGLGTARLVHPWPFYPALVATVASLSRLSIDAAAHLTDALLLALASAAFVLLVRELDDKGSLPLLAAAVVLAQPWLNRTRAFVVRDFGAWAFALLALVELLRFGRTGRARASLAWSLFIVAAALFRPESMALVPAGVLALACDRRRRPAERLRLIGLLLAPLVAIAGSLLWLVAGRAVRVPLAWTVVAGALGNLRHSAAALAGGFPYPSGREYAPYVLVWGLAAVPVAKLVKATGLVALVLALLGMVKARPGGRFERAALGLGIAAGLCILYAQVLTLLFVETRYAVFPALVLSAWAPFGLAWLLRPEATRGMRAAGAAAGLALAASAILSSPALDHAEDHVKAAALWIARNTPADARLHTNSWPIAYQTGRPVDWKVVAHTSAYGPLAAPPTGIPDYWALRVAPGQADVSRRLDQDPALERLAAFTRADGDAVLVYRRRPAPAP